MGCCCCCCCCAFLGVVLLSACVALVDYLCVCCRLLRVSKLLFVGTDFMLQSLSACFSTEGEFSTGGSLYLYSTSGSLLYAILQLGYALAKPAARVQFVSTTLTGMIVAQSRTMTFHTRYGKAHLLTLRLRMSWLCVCRLCIVSLPLSCFVCSVCCRQCC